MLFADTTGSKTDSEKITYFSFNFGTSTVQFFAPPEGQLTIAKAVQIHYIPKAKASILCLGDNCAVCKRNIEIHKTSQDPMNDPNYIRRDTRFLSYVLNLTLNKRCPFCGADNLVLAPKAPDVCGSCQSMITDAPQEPLNKIQVMSISRTLAADLNNFVLSDFEGKADEFLKHEIKIIVKPTTPGSTKRNYMFKVGNRVDSVLDASNLPPVESVVINLTPDEQVMLLDGVSLKDIYSIRRDSERSVSKAVLNDDDLDSRIALLFGK